MKQVTRKIGVNRSKRRIWLEGQILINAGFTHRTRFMVTNHNNRLVIETDPNGKRGVAGRPDRPIIDMTGKTITDSLADEITAVTITSSPGKLVLKGI